MVDTAANIIADDRTSVLVRFHASFEDTMLEAVLWQLDAYDKHTGNDLKKWIQRQIWLKYWVWIELKYIRLTVLSQNYGGELTHHRQLVYNEQVLEVLRQFDQPQIEARRNPITVRELPYKRPRTEFDMPHCW